MEFGGLVIHLDNTLGAAFIGGFVAAILYGITNVQILLYYQSAMHDPLYMKSLVGLLWGLDGLHLAFIAHALYTYMVTNFGNLFAIAKPTWSILAHVVVTNISDLIVRLVFARRIWLLSHSNWYLTCNVVVLSIVVFVGGMGFAIKSCFLPTFLDFAKISWVLYVSLGSAVAADVAIAGTLCYLLNKNRTGFRASDSIVNTLMVYCVNTGLLTSLCAILSLVTYAAMPNNFVFIAFYFALSKLYLNSLLATLNARDTLREKNATQGSVSFPMTSLSPSPAERDGFRSISVSVETVVDKRVDLAEQPKYNRFSLV